MQKQAILLAAGVGRRLASLDQQSPKCLLSFDGSSLLQRHLENLVACGVTECCIVVGHLAEQVEAAARAAAPNGLELSFALNEDYRNGSVISLKVGLEAASEERDLVIMDADVLYDTRVLSRLVDAAFKSGFLLDPRSESDGEEMMLGVADGCVQRITRRIGPKWELIGEGVGFFKLQNDHRGALLAEIEAQLAAGNVKADYEDAIDAYLHKHPAGFADVSDLPWTEIDFDEDVEHARNVILPAIKRAGSGTQATAASL
ncbi:MAG: phosphocholine cytidylyltransferase family protein [Myxococcales bacterium]|nr:phosphocholine cytidylyltransferase family protein [Myxococcales bacterium]